MTQQQGAKLLSVELNRQDTGRGDQRGPTQQPFGSRAWSIWFGWTVTCLTIGGPLAAQVPATERAALVAFYEATGGDEWTVNDGWLGPVGTECSWFGVACAFGQVDDLILDDNNLSGTLPEAIGEVSRLRRMSVRRNKISGGIPASLYSLSELENLVLSGNPLGGELSPEIGQLTNLNFLGLSVTQLTGSIPSEIGQLTEMRSLFLALNDLTGEVPRELWELANLEQLSLSYNRLEGLLAPEIGDLEQLTVLSLGSNQFSGAVPKELARLTRLERLNLFYNRLTVDDPDVEAFLDELLDEDLELTQTIPPSTLLIDPVDADSILVRWSPIAYTADDGGYRVEIRSAPGETFETVADIPGKTSFFTFVNGLAPTVNHDFRVRSYTLPHDLNFDEVESEPSEVLGSTTAPADSPGYLEVFTRSRVSEGETRFAVVRRFGGGSGRVTVDYSFVDGSATLGEDFVATAGTVVFEDGEVVNGPLLQIDYVEDDELESDESFEIVLSNPTGGATISSARGRRRVVIAENDLAETVSDVSSSGTESDIAAAPDGRRVVVWSDNDEDGSGVFGQLYDAAGRPSGERFQVNEQVEGDQGAPDVAFDPATGGFVVVWQSARQGTSTVLGRRFDPQGGATESEQTLDDRPGENTDPSVVVGSDGRVRVVWAHVPLGNPSTPQPVGARRRARGAKATSGSILGRTFEPSGQPSGPSVEVSEESAEATEPQISINDDDEAAVVWQESDEESGEQEVKARVFDSGGAPKGPAISVPGDMEGASEAPAVVGLSTGGFLVAWQGNSESEPTFDVFAQRVASDGTRVGDSFLVNQGLAGSQERPRVVVNEQGQCWVGWQNSGGGGDTGIVGRPLPNCDAQGAGSEAEGEDQQLVSGTDGILVQPDFSLDDEGRVTAVFAIEDRESSDGGVKARVTNVAGTVEGCTATSSALCLTQDRFQVTVEWSDPSAGSGIGQARRLTADTGTFYFFDEDNVELVVKVLDACGLSGRYWVFAGGLTDVRTVMRVVDSQTATVREYINPADTPFQPIQDTAAFDCP